MRNRNEKLQSDIIINANLQGDEISEQIFNNQNEELAFVRGIFDEKSEGRINFSDNLENSFFQTFLANQQESMAPISALTNSTLSYTIIPNTLADQANSFQFKSIQSDGIDFNNFDELDEISNTINISLPNDETLNVQRMDTVVYQTTVNNAEKSTYSYTLLETINQQAKTTRFYFSEFNKKHPVPANLVDQVKHEGKARTAKSKFYIDINGVKTRVYSESQADHNALFSVTESGVNIKITNPAILNTHYETRHGRKVEHFVIINNQATLVYSREQARKLVNKITKARRDKNIDHVQPETPFEGPNQLRLEISNGIFTPIESTTQYSTRDLAEEEITDTTIEKFCNTYSDIPIEQQNENYINFSDNLDNSFCQTFPLCGPASSFTAISNELALQANSVQLQAFDELDVMSNTTKVNSPNDVMSNIQGNKTSSQLFTHTLVLRKAPRNTSQEAEEGGNVSSLLGNTKAPSKKVKSGSQYYFSKFNKKNPIPKELVSKITHEGKFQTRTSKFYIDLNGVKTRVYSKSQVNSSSLFHMDMHGVKRKIKDPEILKTHFTTMGDNGSKINHFVMVNNQQTLVYSRAQAYQMQNYFKLQSNLSVLNDKEIEKNSRKRNSEHVQEETPFENQLKKMRL